jgi:hypothetical protein
MIRSKTRKAKADTKHGAQMILTDVAVAARNKGKKRAEAWRKVMDTPAPVLNWGKKSTD